MSTETDKRSAKVFIAIPIEHMDADPAAIAMRKAILGCLPDGVRFSNDRIRRVNLRFLGDVAPDAVDELGDRLADIAGQHRPFALNLHRMGMFDRNNTISATVWVGIGGDVAALEALHADVATAAHVLGFPLCWVPVSTPYHRRPYRGCKRRGIRSPEDHDWSAGFALRALQVRRHRPEHVGPDSVSHFRQRLPDFTQHHPENATRGRAGSWGPTLGQLNG